MASIARVGEQFLGQPLGGLNKISYWTGKVTGGTTSSEDWRLQEVLDDHVDEVLSKSGELADFFSTGGALNYFVGLFGTQNFGITLSPELMNKLAAAKIELQLDVYP